MFICKTKIMSKEETRRILKEFIKDSPASDNWREKTEFRNANKAWLKKSAQVAVKILRSLREKKMTQVQLAELLTVSPQQVNKILKGRENLTLETITRLESVLGIELITILKSDEKVVKSLEWDAMLTYYFPCEINDIQFSEVIGSECAKTQIELRA